MTRDQYIKHLKRFTNIYEGEIPILIEECELHDIVVDMECYESNYDNFIYFPGFEHALEVIGD